MRAFFIYLKMKKILILSLALITLTATAHEPQFSMYKKQETIKTNEQKFLNGNTAGAWALAGGFSLFAGSMVKVFTISQEAPSQSDFTDLNEYKSKLDSYNQNQKSLNTGFYIGVGFSGFCFMVSGIELMSRPIANTEKTVLKLKTTPGSIGLCLNFK